MGQTHVTARLWDLAENHHPFEDEFLIDTGAIDCMAPAESLSLAGITPEGENVYELANGESVKYDYGFARIEFMGYETVTQVIFGPENSEPIIGVVALENAGIAVDPVSRKLKQMTARPLKGIRPKRVE